MSAFKDLTGQIFGKLTVLYYAGKASDERSLWQCLCTCGKESTKRSDRLVGEHAKSCGDRACRWGLTSEELRLRRKVRTKASQKKYSLKARYKLPYEGFQKKLADQDGKCAICKDIMGTPNVDHDHTTNKTRDLLCTLCNHLLGNAKEDIFILEKAIDYLRRHREQ